MLKIGIGYDFHRLKEGRPLMLGGVKIPYELGEDAHSDGDIVLHAVIDALLGAEGKTDLGELFPPSNPSLRGISSTKLLSTAWNQIKQDGWKLENVDCVVIIEQPKLNPYRDTIITSIARIFVKFKTHEALGDIGNNKAIACIATALISK